MIEPNFVRPLILAGSVLLYLSSLCFQVSAATNDNFSNAQVLIGASGTTSGDNIGATKQAGEPDHAGNAGGSSVWYRWTAPSTGQFFFNTSGSDFDTLLAVYTGNNVNSLTPITSNDDANFDLTSAVSILATSGTVYRVAVDGFDGETGAVALAWGPEVPPANDYFTNAQLISGAAGSVTGTNVGATREIGEPDHAGSPASRSIWFRWTAPSTNEVSVTTAGSDFDTTLAVYTGGSVNALTQVASNDEFAADSTSALTFFPTAGTSYRIAVDGFSGAMGFVKLNWGPPINTAGPAPEVSFSVLRHFTNDINGFSPIAPVIGFGNRLYGTTETHNSGAGTIFVLNTDGTGFTVLKTLNGGATEGGNPEGALIASGETLYGTLPAGGAGFSGAVFALKTNGTGFNLLHSFAPTSGPLSTNADGVAPRSGLVLSGDTLYGVAQLGGNFGMGTVFSLKTNGAAFTTLHHFPEIVGANGTNSDGAKPLSALVITGNTLYGVAINGGNSGYGTVFTLKTNGAGFATLRQFNVSDGYFPRALILSGSLLYGITTPSFFAMNTNGTGFTNLASFLVPGRGAPYGPIVLSGDRIYGSTLTGGAADSGTIYSFRTNGTGYVMLHQFAPRSGPSLTNSDGAIPRGVSVYGNAIYGTAEAGGNWGYGTVFRLALSPPALTITRAGNNVLLKWPASPGGFNLQTATNLVPPVTWVTNSSAPAFVNGLNTVTNLNIGSQRYFRLQQTN
jgi:uncharacterized repeat protein (TIGR03803 family)